MAVYEGDMVNGKPHGKGKLIFYDKSGNEAVYEGDFIDGKLHGKGKYTDKWGVYEGDFANDNKNGKGKLTYADGNIYEGDFMDGWPHGKGKAIYPDGTVLEGNWKEGEFVRKWPRMDLKENDSHEIKAIDGLKKKEHEDEIIEILKNNPTLRELAKAVSEEFDENGNYIGE